MTLSRNINFDENEGLDEMPAGLDLTPSRMKTHKIQKSEENEALDPVLQVPHIPIKSTLHAESPAFLPFPTLNPSWDEIKELLDDEAHNFRYDFADEIAQHSLLQQQRKLFFSSAKRIMDDQKRIEDARMMLQAPSVYDCDDFSSQFAEIERAELLIEETSKTQFKLDAAVDLSFAERKKEEENEEVYETFGVLCSFAQGKVASCSTYDHRGTRRMPDLAPVLIVSEIKSVTKPGELDCLVTPTFSSESNLHVKPAADNVFAMG